MPVFVTCTWDYDYALGTDIATQRTICGQEQLQETMQHLQALFEPTRPCMVSVLAYSFGLRLYLGIYKRIDHQKVAYKIFCSILQYTIKVKKLELKINFQFKKGVESAIKSKETSSQPSRKQLAIMHSPASFSYMWLLKHNCGWLAWAAMSAQIKHILQHIYKI